MEELGDATPNLAVLDQCSLWRWGHEAYVGAPGAFGQNRAMQLQYPLRVNRKIVSTETKNRSATLLLIMTTMLLARPGF